MEQSSSALQIYLPNSNKDINYHDETLGTSLYQAMKNQDKYSFEKIIKDPLLDINQSLFNHHLSYLMASILHKDSDYFFLNSLLGSRKDEINFNYQNKTGENILLFLLEKRFFDINVFKKIYPFCDPNLTDKNKHTILMKAVINDNHGALSFILAQGNLTDGEVGFTNELGTSALSLAQDPRKKKMRILLENRVLPEMKTEVGIILSRNDLREYAKKFYDQKILKFEDAQMKIVNRKSDLIFMNLKIDKGKIKLRQEIISIFEGKRGKDEKVIPEEDILEATVVSNDFIPIAKPV
eukprot:maker-scaffold_6-snap-gene-0.56-mRNA-1 protein AED:0.02 eAED:0.02 QI:126/1/1/1/0.5/0.33/3/69/294